VVVLHERHLRRLLRDYLAYHHRWRTHLSLEMDCPEPREVHAKKPRPGRRSSAGWRTPPPLRTVRGLRHLESAGSPRNLPHGSARASALQLRPAAT
jgi:hypothetical protein